MKANAVVWCIVVILSTLGAFGDEDVGVAGGKKLTFKTPKLSSEEAYSRHIPQHLKCDACRVVAFQLYSKFKEFNRLHKHLNYNVPESEIIDMTESVCTNPETFNGYGLKEVDGVNRLSGPGLETSGVAGVLSGGGKWPGRLMEVCNRFVEELGDEGVYAIYHRDPSKKRVLEDALCYGDGIFSDCEGYKRKYFMEL